MSGVLTHFEGRKPQWEELDEILRAPIPHDWVNLGGQPVTAADLACLQQDICNGTLDSWDAIHHRYDELWQRYPTDKLHHALHGLCSVFGTDTMTADLWLQALAHEERIQRRISEQVYLTRKKDHDNPFRASTCRNADEVVAVFGTADDNSFVQIVREEMLSRLHEIERLRASL